MKSRCRRADDGVVQTTITESAAGDWPHIWRFLREIFAEGRTYTVPLDVAEKQARAMWMPGPPWHTAVAVDGDPAAGGRIVGSAKMGPNQHGPGAHVATASFAVAPAASGRGTGRALGAYMLDWARGQGYRSVQFNAVVQTNTRAVELWRSLGFATVGTVPDAFALPDGTFTGLHVMYRPL